jgi:nucleotide-binding universal stress UspA family protein
MPSPIVVGVALRADDRAPLALARVLARLAGAPLALVTSYPYGGAPLFVTPPSVIAMRDRAQQVLDGVVDEIAGDLEGTTHVRPELSPALALRDVAIELDAAAIVVGSSHRGPVGRVLAGSVGAGVLHGAPCPVAIAPRGYEPPADGFRRIGAGFVDTLEGRDALAAATGIARVTGGRVTVLAVEEPIQRAPAPVTPGRSSAPAHQAELEAHARLSAGKAKRSVPADVLASVEAPAGDPRTILADRSGDLDLLVCGSRGYGPVRSVMLGSVSRALAHSARCPLLIVPRPPARDATKLWRRRAAPEVPTPSGA